MLNFGTVGSGWITDEYIHGAKDSGDWKLTAVYSRTKERGKEYAQKHSAEFVFTSLEEMAKSSVIDAVYIASPNSLHYEHCETFLRNGKHVICEKPICAQAKKVEKLQKLAEKNHVIFLEAIMFMHLPQRKLLEDCLSKIGEVSMAKIDFCQRSSKLDAYLKGDLPNIFNPELETGSLMDLGVYCVYPAIHLFGKPKSFNIDSVLLKTGSDGNGIITMNYPNMLLTLTYSKLGQASANSEFQGTDGTVSVASISRIADVMLRHNDGSTEAICGGDEKYRLMGFEAKDFHRFIVEQKAARAEYEYCMNLSLEVSKFMEEARKQAGILFVSDRA